jgi:hypothetical protein
MWFLKEKRLRAEMTGICICKKGICYTRKPNFKCPLEKEEESNFTVDVDGVIHYKEKVKA